MFGEVWEKLVGMVGMGIFCCFLFVLDFKIKCMVCGVVGRLICGLWFVYMFCLVLGFILVLWEGRFFFLGGL